MDSTETSEPTASSSNDGDKITYAGRPDSLNNVMLIGRLAADPELRRTSTGLAVTHFRVATNVRGKTEFHSVVAWRRLGELVARQFSKGHMIRVDGSLHGHSWKTDNGETRRSVEVVADWCYTVGPPPRE
jgi:single-strand DNA-binding protein